MSDYASTCRGDVSDPDELLRHHGDADQFLPNYQRIAKTTVEEGPAGLRRLAPSLPSIIADPRLLYSACEHVAAHGGRAAGHDGRRLSDYSASERWSLCRALSKAILDGTYRPSSERYIEIEKVGKSGTRTIVVLNLPDRIVQRAVTMVLQPLLDPGFDDRSFGFRPRRSRLHALATAECLAREEKRNVLLVHDLRDAFGSVPIGRLLDVIKQHFPDASLIELLRRTLTSKNGKGLRQGGSASSLMLNVYLDHYLDRMWRKSHPDIPLVRYGDDLLVLCRDDHEAALADAELRRILRPTGMKLKASYADALFDLDAGEKPVWLGFHIWMSTVGILKKVPKTAFPSLRRKLRFTHTRDDSGLRAEQLILAWVRSQGPVSWRGNREGVCKKLRSLARTAGFDEVPSVEELMRTWKRASSNWRRLKKRIRNQLT